MCEILLTKSVRKRTYANLHYTPYPPTVRCRRAVSLLFVGRKAMEIIMKKVLLSICATAVALTLTACGNNTQGGNAMNDAKGRMAQDARRGIDAAEDGVQKGMDAVEGGVQKGIENSERAVKDGIDMIEGGVDSAGNAIKDGTDAVEDAADAGLDAAENGVEWGADAAADAARGIHNGTQKAVEYGADVTRNAGEYINDSMNRDQGWVPYSGTADGASALDGTGGVVEAADGNVPSNFEMISGFSTRLYDTEPARVDNIKLAISKMDETLLQPGETFSFNTIIGERSTEAGFQEARALWMKEAVREVGGGVCQLSTTVYQAAKQAGLPIVERHPHQKPVNYVEEGMDACVDYGVFDLSFQNNTDRVLKVKGSCDGVYVYVTIEREVR